MVGPNLYGFAIPTYTKYFTQALIYKYDYRTKLIDYHFPTFLVVNSKTAGFINYIFELPDTVGINL